MIHIHWSTHPYGARNYYRGEYDTSLFFVLRVWGVPVFASLRGCVHTIPVNRLGVGERRNALRGFAAEYLGLPAAKNGSLPPKLDLPLRRTRALRRAGLVRMALPVFGVAGLFGVVLVLMLLQMGLNRFAIPEYQLVLALSLLALGLFAVCWYLHRRYQRTSPRQARIRRLVGVRLGPYTDPADWAAVLVEAVAYKFGVDELAAGPLLEHAEASLKDGDYADALVTARMALAIADPFEEDDIVARAEEITDICVTRDDTSDSNSAVPA